MVQGHRVGPSWAKRSKGGSAVDRAGAAACRAVGRKVRRARLANPSTEQLTAVFTEYCRSLPPKERARLDGELALQGLDTHGTVQGLVIWFRARLRLAKFRTEEPRILAAADADAWYPKFWEMPCGITQ